MVKKSKKSKSKRMSLRQKYKVIRKVKEHTKKKAKEAKKAGKRKKPIKDPGIPNQWPFKEQLIQELDQQKQHILAEEQKRKEQRKQAKLDAKAAGDEEMAEPAGLEAVRAEAAARQRQFETAKRARLAAQSPEAQHDSSRRAFYKEFLKVVEAADVVIQVLDARDPASCRCADVEHFIRHKDPAKKVVLLLNKIDLVPREVVNKWLAYLREELPTVAFKCSTQKQGANLGHKRLSTAESASWQGSECLGAENLLQLLKNYARNNNMKTSITVGIVGLPNVGKSSLINSLKRARVAQVGNTPGVTRAVQEVTLDRAVKLLDCPGIVFSSGDDANTAANALRNCVKVEQVADPVLPVQEIVRRCPSKQLMALYKTSAFKSTDEFLQLVATARGKLKKGGVVDVEAAARLVLQDWNDGRIKYYTLPPTRDQGGHDSAEIVPEWARAFNADEVYANEARTVVAALPATADAAAHFFATEPAGPTAAVGLADMETGGPEEGPGDDADGDSDEDEAGEAEEMDEGNAVTALLERQQGGKRKSSSEQNDTLYSEEGQFNPHAARAQRKRQKRQQAVADDAGSDFDFEEWGDEDGAAPLTGQQPSRFPQVEDEDDHDDDDDDEEDEAGSDQEGQEDEESD